ncbi:hypothetical protein GCM10027061_17180 [Nesterenkonia suensis]
MGTSRPVVAQLNNESCYASGGLHGSFLTGGARICQALLLGIVTDAGLAISNRTAHYDTRTEAMTVLMMAQSSRVELLNRWMTSEYDMPAGRAWKDGNMPAPSLTEGFPL